MTKPPERKGRPTPGQAHCPSPAGLTRQNPRKSAEESCRKVQQVEKNFWFPLRTANRFSGAFPFTVTGISRRKEIKGDDNKINDLQTHLSNKNLPLFHPARRTKIRFDRANGTQH
ncbi:hypothetical protein RUM43_002470 [Polyplax serrata]|uniref:Uncharacterized protein n=1 Tax=Polyplax serrata TaxID=468196 RepID=A0AAN8S2N2_POLSC